MAYKVADPSLMISLLLHFNMFSLESLWFVFALLWIRTVKCENTCEFYNIDYKELVAGIDGKVESSEPLHLDIIEAELPTLKYSVLNATMSGIKDCEPIHVQCDKNSKNELTFEYNIQCPHVILTSEYDADGKLGSLIIEGHGSSRVDAEDYVIKLSGKYETVVGEDQKSRPVITKHTIETDPQGIVKFHIENKFHGDKEREALTNRFLNENWREMEKIMRSPTIYSIIELLIENLNIYSKAK